MRRSLRLCSLVIFGFLLSLPAMGAERTPWYQVELLVFARANAPVTDEAWPTERAPVAGRELVPWRGFTGADTVPFQRVPQSALKLGWEYTRLKKEFKPLLHTGWLQPGLARSDAAAVHIRSEDGSVDGTVRVVLSRYLHLETNLNYRRTGDANLAEGTRPIFTMAESRRMRSREVHYLDHPMFGVIAVITPYDLSGR